MACLSIVMYVSAWDVHTNAVLFLQSAKTLHTHHKDRSSKESSTVLSETGIWAEGLQLRI